MNSIRHFEEAAEEMNKNLRKFKGNSETGTDDASNLMAISDLEKLCKVLRTGNDKIYSGLVSAYLNNNEEERS